MSESTPTRITLSRRKGWRMPENSMKVTRPGKWGNPYRVGIDGDAAECVRLFKAMSESRPEYQETARVELAGKNLACFCKQGAPCHADVLLRIANSCVASPLPMKNTETRAAKVDELKQALGEIRGG